MSRHLLVLGDTVATVSDDARFVWTALVVGRVVDDLSTPTAPLPAPDRIRVVGRLRGVDPTGPGEAARFHLTTGSGGQFALAGAVERALPDIATTAHVVDLAVEAPGFLPAVASVAIPAGTTQFPVPAIEVRLRRPAVRLVGRVVAKGATPTPLPGRLVEVIDPPGLVGSAPAFVWSHGTGTALMPVTVTPAGPDLGWTDDQQPGATTVALGRRDGLAAGAALLVGAPAADQELVIVDSITGPATLSRPGTALLRTPLAAAHRAGTSVRRAAVAPSGPAAVLTVDLDAGSTLGFVDHPERLPEGQAFRIDDADPARVELRTARAPAGTTDGDGYYRTGPVGGARTVVVRITPSVGPVTATEVLRFDQPDNVVNLSV